MKKFLSLLLTLVMILSAASFASADQGAKVTVGLSGDPGNIGPFQGMGLGRIGILFSRYFEQDDLPGELPITLKVKGIDLRGAKLYLVDETHDLEEIPYRMDKDGNLLFGMKANTVVYLEAGKI